MPIPITKRIIPNQVDELPFTVHWYSPPPAQLSLNEAQQAAAMAAVEQWNVHRPSSTPDLRAIAESACALSVARRGRAQEPPMEIARANTLTDAELGLLSTLPRISLGRFRALFVIYSRNVAESLDPQGFSIKAVYGNASTADYQAHARLLGIENLFYRLVLENAEAISMHPGHLAFWQQEEQKRKKHARRKTVYLC